MKKLFVVCFLSLWVPMSVFADGMPIGEDGRFEGGETIVIGLSDSQKQRLAKSPMLKLSAEQKQVIRRTHGFSPSELFIYNTRKGDNDCTCDAYNRGLWFHEGMVEVPRMYLVTDKRAREIEKVRAEM